MKTSIDKPALVEDGAESYIDISKSYWLQISFVLSRLTPLSLVGSFKFARGIIKEVADTPIFLATEPI
jgi:hypothetical protein